MKKPWTERFGDFMAGKGFYIVLFLCVAAIGISGYYLFSSLGGNDPAAPVAGTAQVTVTPSPLPSATPSAPTLVTPEKPATPSPSPVVSAQPDPAPSATPTPAPEHQKPVAKVYTWPVKGTVLMPYSPHQPIRSETMADIRTHAGIDIAAELGAQVKAVGDGTVETVTSNYFEGTKVVIDHGNGVKSICYNLAEQPPVKAGDEVSVGDIIGSVGKTANREIAEDPHLHFEMTNAGVTVNPYDYLPEIK